MKSINIGKMIGGLSTIAFSGILKKIEKIMPGLGQIRSILVLESTIVDPVRIMVAVSLIKVLLRGDVHPFSVILRISSEYFFYNKFNF